MTLVSVFFDFPPGFTVRDLSHIYDMMYDLCPGFDGEFVTWDKDGMGAGDDLLVDLDGLTEAVRAHGWDVVPIVTVHDGMAESVIEMESDDKPKVATIECEWMEKTLSEMADLANNAEIAVENGELVMQGIFMERLKNMIDACHNDMIGRRIEMELKR